MTVTSPSLDPAALRTAAELLGQTLDPLRAIYLPQSDDPAWPAALAALANTRGGWILVGARLDGGGAVDELTGVDADEAELRLRDHLTRIDPPLSGLVRTTVLPLQAGASLFVVSVRQSPSPPHIDVSTGSVFVHGTGGPRPIAARTELDRLYQRGREPDERAQRLMDTVIGRLSLAQFGHFGLAVVACLRAPSADPYCWCRDHPEDLADPSDPFVGRWGFTAGAVRVRPGEVELRNDREVTGVLRVGRAGYAVAAEILARPRGDVVGSPDELAQHISTLHGTLFRVLRHADDPVVLPRLFCEGFKSTRLQLDERPESRSAPCAVDAVQAQGTAGDLRDPAYRRELHNAFSSRLLAAYGLGWQDDAGA